MKPHRMKMTHELVSAYDMLGKMDVVVRLKFWCMLLVIE